MSINVMCINVFHTRKYQQDIKNKITKFTCKVTIIYIIFFFQSSDSEDNPDMWNNTTNKINKSTNYIVAEHINKYKASHLRDFI